MLAHLQLLNLDRRNMPTYIPKVSIIVPVYNGASTIAACIESLLAQDYPAHAYDIIVVENGSTDSTPEIVAQYPVRLFHHTIRGPAAARNFGIARSTADIIAFTDADCIAHPRWIAELVKPYQDPVVGGAGGAILAYDHPGRNFVEMFSETNAPLVNFVKGAVEFLPRLYTANASYRKHILDEIGGFNPHIITGQDVDIAWRVQLQTGTQLHYAPEAIIYHHHRATKRGLARQYRRYGFGEIMLDTMYGKYPGYPRSRGTQLRRILNQLAALPRYTLSILLRQVRLARGRITPYQAVVPQLWLMIEWNNIYGKLEGLVATRFMTDARSLLSLNSETVIDRLFQSQKE